MRFTSIQSTSSVTTGAPSNRQCAATTSVTMGATSVRSSAAPRATRGRGTLPRKTTRATQQAQRSVQPEPRPPATAGWLRGSCSRRLARPPHDHRRLFQVQDARTAGDLVALLAACLAPRPPRSASSRRCGGIRARAPRPRHTRRGDARATRYPGAYRAETRPSVGLPSAPSTSSSRKGFRTAKS
jgi:hypothetical protein